MPSLENQFSKITALSLIYFLNDAYYDFFLDTLYDLCLHWVSVVRGLDGQRPIGDRSTAANKKDYRLYFNFW